MEYSFASQFWYCELCVENRRGRRERAESIVLLIFVIWRCFNRRWMRGCGLRQKVLFRASSNCIFFQPGFKPAQWAWFILACCIDWIFLQLFLCTIVVSDFLPLEIHKHLVLPLSGITFIVNSQADNHFYKYISLYKIYFFVYYAVWNQFLIKIHVKTFYIQVEFKCEIPHI